MFKDYGNCRDCGRSLALVGHHPNEGMCHPCWTMRHVPMSPFVRRALARELPAKEIAR